jgi:hypothetical protein
MAITVTTTVDIAEPKRTAVDPVNYQPLSDAASFFDQGDTTFEVQFFNDGVAYDVAAEIGLANLLLVIANKANPDAPALVISSNVVAGAASHIAIFTANTATVELQEYLQGTIERRAEITVFDNTAPANPQVLASWTARAINRTFDPNLAIPVYTNLQHKLAVNPDRQPNANDDETLGYSLGSIWLYHNLANPTQAEIWICRFSSAGAAIWDLIAPVTTVSGFQIIQVPFNFNTISPLTLLNVENGDVIVNTSIDIIEAFDDISTDISIGTAANNDLLLDSGDNDPTNLGLYEDTKNTSFVSSQAVALYINAGASTEGDGLATIYINKV